MSARVCGVEQTADPLRPNLEALVRNLDRDTARSKRLIRQFLEEDREGFFRCAVPILKADVTSRGAQFLLEVAIRGGLLLALLGDPGLSLEEALAAAQAAARLDPNADLALARTLADGAGDADAAHPEQHTRLMEILAAISDGSRIFPSLVRLMRHPNPHIRSKAVLMIGRGNRSAKWVRQRLADADPRIRANAAEALWGVNTDEAREVLQSLVHDSHNRVAGNALLGLYRLGDNAVIPDILRMAGHDSALFRSTAAWVMGETRDPRFTECLAGLLREPHAVIRRRAFTALGRIRAAVARARDGPPCRLAARLLDPDPARPGRRVQMGVLEEEGRASLTGIVPTQILLSEDGQAIMDYRVTERPLPETISVVFLLAPGGAAAVLECLPWKRAGDLWAWLYYAPPDGPAGPSGRSQPWISRRVYPAGNTPRFYCSAETIASELERNPEPFGDLWRCLAQAVDTDTGPMPGKRHVIILNEPGPRAGPAEDLVSAVAAAHALVQAVSTGPDPALQDFCRRAGGVFRDIGGSGTVDAYVNLLARYEIAYQPPNANARELKIRVHGADLCAGTTLPLVAP